MAFAITAMEEGEQQAVKIIEIPSEQVRLVELQEVLCRTFRQRFPFMMVSITVNGVTFDEFHLQPFGAGAPTEPCRVKFTPTDNPFFYDLRDRRPQTPRLGDEMHPRAAAELPALDGIRALVE
jgi:hypothetical protein